MFKAFQMFSRASKPMTYSGVIKTQENHQAVSKVIHSDAAKTVGSAIGSLFFKIFPQYAILSPIAAIAGKQALDSISTPEDYQKGIDSLVARQEASKKTNVFFSTSEDDTDDFVEVLRVQPNESGLFVDLETGLLPQGAIHKLISNSFDTEALVAETNIGDLVECGAHVCQSDDEVFNLGESDVFAPILDFPAQ